MCFGVVFRPVERPAGLREAFSEGRILVVGMNWREGELALLSEFMFADCIMVTVAISNSAMIRSENWVSLKDIQRSPNYIVHFAMKKRNGIGEGALNRGAQEPAERSISDNRDDIRVRNRLNKSSTRLN